MRVPSANRDSVFLIGANVIVALSGIISQFLVLDNLSSFDYGLWILILDAALTIGILVDFGIPDVMIRLWDGTRSHISVIVRTGFEAQFFLAASILVLVLPISYLANIEEVPQRVALMMALGSLTFYLVDSMRIGLRMLGRADEEAVAMIMDRILYISAIYYALMDSPTIASLARAFLLVSILSFTYTSWRYLANRPVGLADPDRTGTRTNPSRFTVIRTSLPFAIALFLFPLLGRVDKFIIAWSEGILSVAVFNIPWLVVLTGLSVPRSIRQATLPDLGANKSSVEKMAGVAEKTWPLTAVLIFIGVPASLFLSDFVFNHIFPARLVSPSNFEFPGTRLLICLLPAWTWAMIGCIDLEALKLADSPYKYSTTIALAIVLNFASGVVLIPIFGILGAAFSSSLAFCSLFLISYAIGPFSTIQKKLALRKLAHGIVYSAALFFIAFNWNSKFIGQSVGIAILLLIISSIPLVLLEIKPIMSSWEAIVQTALPSEVESE